MYCLVPNSFVDYHRCGRFPRCRRLRRPGAHALRSWRSTSPCSSGRYGSGRGRLNGAHGPSSPATAPANGHQWPPSVDAGVGGRTTRRQPHRSALKSPFGGWWQQWHGRGRVARQPPLVAGAAQSRREVCAGAPEAAVATDEKLRPRIRAVLGKKANREIYNQTSFYPASLWCAVRTGHLELWHFKPVSLFYTF
jgi:hypothetical protein